MVKCIEPSTPILAGFALNAMSKMRRNLLGNGQNAIWDVSTK